MIKIAVLLVAISNCLHLDTNTSSPKYNADNYLSDLNARQDKFNSDVLSIRAQI